MENTTFYEFKFCFLQIVSNIYIKFNVPMNIPASQYIHYNTHRRNHKRSVLYLRQIVLLLHSAPVCSWETWLNICLVLGYFFFSGLFCFSSSPGQGLCSPKVTHSCKQCCILNTLSLCAAFASLSQKCPLSTEHWDNHHPTRKSDHDCWARWASHCLLQPVLPRKSLRHRKCHTARLTHTDDPHPVVISEACLLHVGSFLWRNKICCLAKKREVSLLAVFKNQCE